MYQDRKYINVLEVLVRLASLIWFTSICALICGGIYVSFDFDDRFEAVSSLLYIFATVAFAPIVAAILIGLVNWILFGDDKNE